jgi:hypothetical protein
VLRALLSAAHSLVEQWLKLSWMMRNLESCSKSSAVRVQPIISPTVNLPPKVALQRLCPGVAAPEQAEL